MLDNVSISIKGLKGFMKMLLFTETITARAWIFFIVLCLCIVGLTTSFMLWLTSDLIISLVKN